MHVKKVASINYSMDRYQSNLMDRYLCDNGLLDASIGRYVNKRSQMKFKKKKGFANAQLA